ncbi:acetylcholinesterase [Amniculicola lignicola CBS 123094]|uniref:Acetylcholinesterase n=1 Tax=Amniculicola lignicola CBS 123094 TaxID=1392246 RepID=A0A6A5WZ49_9PLEO|nr:acetylcholinesterase [Amniculicola lignicola CBS 123094]
MRNLLVVVFWLYSPSPSLAAPSAIFKTVRTEDDLITGHRSSKALAVWEYLGIPYTQPPVGNLRFAAPQKYTSTTPYTAQAAVQPTFPGFTPQAPKILAAFTAGPGTLRSEDCLTLNIWAKPTIKSSKAKKPVVTNPDIDLTLSGFAGGNTNGPFANGQYLANAEDIIIVSVNYRVNVFGFSGTSGADTNPGLRDQRLAVEWLQKNIAAFGAAAVDWWSYAYTQNPIVRGLIGTSGNAFSFPMNAPQKQVRNWYNISSLVGCGSSGDTLPCMRALPWETISGVVSRVPSIPGGSPVRSTPPFYPMVDGEIIFSDYLSLASSGSFAKVPYFHGHSNYEQGYYVIPAFAQGRNVTEAQTAQFILESSVCPHSYKSRRRAEAGVPTGAYHGTELHMILGGSEDASGLPASQAQKDTSRLFQKAVAAFVDNPESGLTRFGWPKFDASAKPWIEIAVGNKPKASPAKPETYGAPCSTIVMGALPTLT